MNQDTPAHILQKQFRLQKIFKIHETTVVFTAFLISR